MANKSLSSIWFFSISSSTRRSYRVSSSLMGFPPVDLLSVGLFSFDPFHFLGAFGSQTLGPHLPNNTPLFSLIPTHNSDRLTLLYNNNNRGSTSPILSSPINWSPSLPLPLWVPRPEAVEPNSTSTFRHRNEKNKRGRRGRRGSYTGRANIRGGRSTKESGQNSPRENLEVDVKGGSVYNGASPLGCSAWLDQITT